MRITAVIDRLELDKAIILLGEEELQMVWPLIKLPKGAKAGHILKIDVAIDEAATEKAQDEANTLLKEIIENK